MKYDERNDLRWVEISREHVVRDEWIDFRRSAYRFPDGSVYKPYYSYTRRDYAVIVALDEQGRVICVRQYRQGLGEVTTEFPAGGIESKDDAVNHAGRGRGGTLAINVADAALAAARRELLEETGYASDDWTHLITIPSDATLNDNYAFVYLAKNCRRVGEQQLDDMEFLNVELHTPEEVEELIRTGRFQQAVHVMAWLLAQK